MGRVNYGRTVVALLGAWLGLSVLIDVIVRRWMSGGVRISAERIILHLATKSAGIRSRWSHLLTSAVVPPGASIRRSLCTLRAWIDAAGSVNRSSRDADVNRAAKRALCQLRTRAAALDRDIRGADSLPCASPGRGPAHYGSLYRRPTFAATTAGVSGNTMLGESIGTS